MEETFDARLRTPFTGIVSGKPSSGKTFFVYNLLKNQEFFIDQEFKTVYWFYGQDNDFTKSLPKLLPNIDVKLIKGLPTDIIKYMKGKKRCLIVLDDVMRAVTSNRYITDLYSLCARHEEWSVLFLLQNLFYHGSERTTLLRCSQLLVVFDETIDRSMIYTLANKLIPRKPNIFMEIFDEATSKPYRPLLIDGHQSTPKSLRFRAIDFDEKVQHVYQPLEKKK